MIECFNSLEKIKKCTFGVIFGGLSLMCVTILPLLLWCSFHWLVEVDLQNVDLLKASIS